MTAIQRRLNVDATSWRCIDVETTLYKRHVPAWYVLKFEQLNFNVLRFEQINFTTYKSI